MTNMWSERNNFNNTIVAVQHEQNGYPKFDYKIMIHLKILYEIKINTAMNIYKT